MAKQVSKIISRRFQKVVGRILIWKCAGRVGRTALTLSTRTTTKDQKPVSVIIRVFFARFPRKIESVRNNRKTNDIRTRVSDERPFP